MIMLVVSWHFSAAAMCEYSRQEFLRGMAGLGCDSTDQLRRMLPRLRAELQDGAKFKARVIHGLLGSLRSYVPSFGPVQPAQLRTQLLRKGPEGVRMHAQLGQGFYGDSQPLR